MQTTTLGMTDLNVSRIAFGTWQIGGEWGRFDEDEAIAAIRHARIAEIMAGAVAVGGPSLELV